MTETAPTRITLKGLAGLHVQIALVDDTLGGRVLVSLVKKARKSRGWIAGFDTDVLNAIGDPGELPTIKRDYMDIAQIALAGVYLRVPDATAIKAAEFLGVAFDQRTADERHSP